MNNDTISRQGALDALCDNCATPQAVGAHFPCKQYRSIKALPVVDAVEVVRCKDCKWFNEVGCAINIVDESDKPHEDDFCSFAERRTER